MLSSLFYEKKFLNKFIQVTFILTLLFSWTEPSLAATVSGPASSTSSTSTLQQVESFKSGIRMQDLTLDKKNYTVGDAVNGSFVLKNIGDIALDKLSYQVMFVGLQDKSKAPKTFYDVTQPSSPIIIEAKGNRAIKFSYKLSSVPSDKNLGIMISVKNIEGRVVGWDSKPVAISGQKTYILEPLRASLSSKGESSENAKSIRISAGDELSLSASYANKSKETITAIPVLVVMGEDEKPINNLSKTQAQKREIKPNSPETFSFDISTQKLKPGNYMTYVSVIDSHGVERVPAVSKSFIVTGDFVSVRGAYTNLRDFTFKQSETVPIAFFYTGSTGIAKSPVSINADVSVQLFNEKKELLGETNITQIFGKSGYMTIPIKINKNTKSRLLGVSIVVKKGPATLSLFEGGVVYDPSKISNPSVNISNSHALMYVIFVLGILAIIAGVIAYRRRDFRTLFSLVFVFISIGSLSLSSVVHGDGNVVGNILGDSIEIPCSSVNGCTVDTNMSIGVQISQSEIDSTDTGNTEFYFAACDQTKIVSGPLYGGTIYDLIECSGDTQYYNPQPGECVNIRTINASLVCEGRSFSTSKEIKIDVCGYDDGPCPIEGQIRDWWGCHCDQYMQEVGGKCVPECRENQTRNINGDCVCGYGYEDVNGEGLCKTPCTGGQQRNANGDCECPNGKILDGQMQCVCPPGKVEDGAGSCKCSDGFAQPDASGVCKCIPGYAINGIGQCEAVRCTSPKVLSGSVCVCAAPLGDDGRGGCQRCGLTETANPATGSCDCRPPYVRDSSGACVTCSSDEIYNSTSQSCGCGPSLSRDQSGACVSCASNETFNSTTGSCDCASSLVRNATTGVCESQCSNPDMHNSNGVCVCNSPLISDGLGGCNRCPQGQVFNSSTGSCGCPDQYVLNNGVCSPCSLGMVFSAGSCVCPDLAPPVNGQCTNGCTNGAINPDYCDWCGTGYEMGAAGTCVASCGNRAYNNGTGCSCYNGSTNPPVISGDSASALPSPLPYNTSGMSCNQCPSGYIYSTARDSCEAGCLNGTGNAPDCNSCSEGSEALSGTDGTVSSCRCLNGAVNSPNCSVCPQGQIVGLYGQCIPACPAKQHWEMQLNSDSSDYINACACNNGGDVKSLPVACACADGSNPKTGICACANGAYNPPSCNNCPPSLEVVYSYDKDGNPIAMSCKEPCSENEYRDEMLKCQCLPGYENDSKGACVQSCSENTQRDALGVCRCKNGADDPSTCSECTDISTTDENGFTVCECGDGSDPTTFCTQCLEGETRDADTGKCIQACPTGEQPDKDGVCQCLSGMERNSEGSCHLVVCPDGTTLTDGACKCNTSILNPEVADDVQVTEEGNLDPGSCHSCVDSSKVYKAQDNTCGCSAGSTADETGTCIQRCNSSAQGATYNDGSIPKDVTALCENDASLGSGPSVSGSEDGYTSFGWTCGNASCSAARDCPGDQIILQSEDLSHLSQTVVDKLNLHPGSCASCESLYGVGWEKDSTDVKKCKAVYSLSLTAKRSKSTSGWTPFSLVMPEATAPRDERFIDLRGYVKGFTKCIGTWLGGSQWYYKDDIDPSKTSEVSRQDIGPLASTTEFMLDCSNIGNTQGTTFKSSAKIKAIVPGFSQF